MGGKWQSSGAGGEELVGGFEPGIALLRTENSHNQGVLVLLKRCGWNTAHSFLPGNISLIDEIDAASSLG